MMDVFFFGKIVFG